MNEAVQDGLETVVGYEANGGFLTASDITIPDSGEILEALPTRDAALPVLSRRALRLLEEAGLAAQTRRWSRALTFVRAAGDPVSAPGR